MTRGKSFKWLQVFHLYFLSVQIDFHQFSAIISNSILVRLQPADVAAVRKPDQQENDITSQETSNHTVTPHRRNGSVAQANVETGIHAITQSASRATLNRGSMAGSVRSPVVTVLPKHRLEPAADRSTRHGFFILSEPL